MTVVKTVEVYVCPMPGCPDYFGSTSMPKLEEVMNLKSDMTHTASYNPAKADEDVTHSRSECPTCRRGGKQVERVRRAVSVTI